MKINVKKLEKEHLKKETQEDTRKIDKILDSLIDAGDVFVLEKSKSEEISIIPNNIEYDLELQYDSIVDLIDLRDDLESKIEELNKSLREYE